MSDLVLTSCQERGLEALNSGRNVFLSGDAGTGKSTLVRHWRQQTRKNSAVTASTGVAALLAGGRTVHSFFGVGTGEADIHAYLADRHFSRAGPRIREIDVLVIDEISMIGSELFEKLETLARYDRRSPEPWGGLQVIGVGDMGQLPPIKDDYCFTGAAWKRTKFKPVLLRTQIRSEDERYGALLKKIRRAEIDDEVRNFLKSREMPDADETWVRIFPRRVDADVWNQRRLHALETPVRLFEATGWGPDWAVKALMSSLPVPTRLTLAEGAYVMFRVNDPGGRYANGTTGYVEKIYDNMLVINLTDASGERSGEFLKVPQYAFKMPGAHDEPIAGVNQFPVQLSWAITTHKCQGATLARAAVDLADMWDPGQVYVAMSRVRRPEDLAILRWTSGSFYADPRVVKFYEIMERVG